MTDRQETLVSIARNGAVLVAVGTFLAILGPYGSSAYGWPQVWIYWTGLILLGAVFGHLGGRSLRALRPDWPRWSWYVAGALVLTIPVTAAVFAINTAYGGRANWSELPLTTALVFVVAAAVSALGYALDLLETSRAAARRVADAPAGHASASPALLDKLPVRLRSADILWMSAEDHYLRVRTEAGEALILMRLSDAAAACATLDGARTHRSWWVARAAVADARKEGGARAMLTLTDGAEVPVSRSYYPALKEAGWF